jgi:hypothetical protein
VVTAILLLDGQSPPEAQEIDPTVAAAQIAADLPRRNTFFNGQSR